jgi:hypothetical protein
LRSVRVAVPFAPLEVDLGATLRGRAQVDHLLAGAASSSVIDEAHRLMPRPRSHSSGAGRPPRADAITAALSLQEQHQRDSSAIIGTSKSNAEDEIMLMYRNFCTAARFAASRWSDPTGGWLDRWSFAL